VGQPKRLNLNTEEFRALLLNMGEVKSALDLPHSYEGDPKIRKIGSKKVVPLHLHVPHYKARYVNPDSCQEVSRMDTWYPCIDLAIKEARDNAPEEGDPMMIVEQEQRKVPEKREVMMWVLWNCLFDILMELSQGGCLGCQVGSDSQVDHLDGCLLDNESRVHQYLTDALNLLKPDFLVSMYNYVLIVMGIAAVESAANDYKVSEGEFQLLCNHETVSKYAAESIDETGILNKCPQAILDRASYLYKKATDTCAQ